MICAVHLVVGKQQPAQTCQSSAKCVFIQWLSVTYISKTKSTIPFQNDLHKSKLAYGGDL